MCGVHCGGAEAAAAALSCVSLGQVAWVPLQKKGEFGVLSASSGGRVLLWTADSDQGCLLLKAAYAFIQHQIPGSSSLKVSASRKEDMTTVTELDLRLNREITVLEVPRAACWQNVGTCWCVFHKG